MNEPMQDPVKRWTAKRKTELAFDIIQGKTTIPEASRYHDLIPSEPRVDPWLAGQTKELIDLHPSFGHRTVAHLLGVNKNTVQRIFQLNNWQAKTRSVGARPKVEAWPSVADAPNERWMIDLANVQMVKDGKLTLALVVDCHMRELVRLARVPPCQGIDAGRRTDSQVREDWTRQQAAAVAQRQRSGVQFKAIHGPGP